MIKINFSEPTFKIKTENNNNYIFDANRRKWVLLTPEEWVRQNFIEYLIQVKKYPASLISIEKEIKLGELKKRYDIVVYNNGVPWMIVECKEMETLINESVVQQILNYNQTLQVSYLIITNGKVTFGFDTQLNQPIVSIPDYHD